MTFIARDLEVRNTIRMVIVTLIMLVLITTFTEIANLNTVRLIVVAVILRFDINIYILIFDMKLRQR